MEAVIFVGLQATGKSTFYQQRFFKTHLRLNMDMLKTRHREAILLRACLESKSHFVLDNTNLTAADRARYIQPAKAARYTIIGFYFHSALAEALERNARRPDRERIPEVGVRGAFKKLQLPTLEEGFDSLYYVRIGEAGDFIVEAWQA